MKITFLGTGAASLQKNRDYTATAIEVGDSVYLIDAGASVFSKMLDYGVNPSRLRAVFITHAHFDHVSGLPMLVNIFSWTKTYGDIPVSYYFPEQRSIDSVVEFIDAIGEGKSVRGDFKTYGAGIIYEDQNIKVFAIPTNHLAKKDGMPMSYAFAVCADKKTVVFSGDLSRELDSEEIFDFLEREKTDVFICELAHFSPRRLLERTKDLPIKELYFNHIAESEKLVSEIEEIRRSGYKFTVSLARDGQFLEV